MRWRENVYCENMLCSQHIPFVLCVCVELFSQSKPIPIIHIAKSYSFVSHIMSSHHGGVKRMLNPLILYLNASLQLKTYTLSLNKRDCMLNKCAFDIC